MSHLRGRVFVIYFCNGRVARSKAGNGGRLQPTSDAAEAVAVESDGPTGSADEASAGQGAGGELRRAAGWLPSQKARGPPLPSRRT
jgi:hypothetical protein